MSDTINESLPTVGLHVLEDTLAGTVGVIAGPAAPFVQALVGATASDLARRMTSALIGHWGVSEEDAQALVAAQPVLNPQIAEVVSSVAMDQLRKLATKK